MSPPPDWSLPPLANEALFLAAAEPRPDSPLVVLLPGAYGRPQDLVEQGFAAALAARHPQAALLLLPIDPLAVTQGVALARLEAALAPWQAHFARIWLAGISLGALLILAHLAETSGGIAGALAMAPYLGTRALEKEIREAGSPAVWAASQPVCCDARELEKPIWRWLAGGGAQRLPLSLGLAREDRFYSCQTLAETCWPAERCFTVSGAHNWPAWHALWTLWLERVDFGDREAHR